MSPFKTCTMCAFPYTEDAWRALPLVGVQYLEFDEDGDIDVALDQMHTRELQELRNCGCGSTLHVRLATMGASAVTLHTILTEHAAMFEVLRDLQARCSELARALRESQRMAITTAPTEPPAPSSAPASRDLTRDETPQPMRTV